MIRNKIFLSLIFFLSLLFYLFTIFNLNFAIQNKYTTISSKPFKTRYNFLHFPTILLSVKINFAITDELKRISHNYSSNSS